MNDSTRSHHHRYRGAASDGRPRRSGRSRARNPGGRGKSRRDSRRCSENAFYRSQNSDDNLDAVPCRARILPESARQFSLSESRREARVRIIPLHPPAPPAPGLLAHQIKLGGGRSGRHASSSRRIANGGGLPSSPPISRRRSEAQPISSFQSLEFSSTFDASVDRSHRVRMNTRRGTNPRSKA